MTAAIILTAVGSFVGGCIAYAVYACMCLKGLSKVFEDLEREIVRLERKAK